MNGRQLTTLGYLVSTVAAVSNAALALIPATQALPWAVLALPFYTFGVALAFPILTLAMLDLFPRQRGSAASVQSFVALLCNAAIAGLLAPLLGFSLWSLAAAALATTLTGWWLWARHLRLTNAAVSTTPDAAAFEPTDEL